MSRYPVLLLLAGFLLIPQTSRAWWSGGHRILSSAAIHAAPELPEFFRKGADAVAEYSADPDLAKDQSAPTARFREAPRHFIDLELLKSNPLPRANDEYAALIQKLGLKPLEVGDVPYAIIDWAERLMLAFAQVRAAPEKSEARSRAEQRCLVYAGFLSHYAEDLVQPLHTTVHHDGKGKQGHGIHAKVDSVIEKSGLSEPDLVGSLKVTEAFDDWFTAIEAELKESHALVDKVYAMEAAFTKPGEGPAQGFAKERAHSGARFLARLFLTAWKKSAALRLPSWL